MLIANTSTKMVFRSTEGNVRELVGQLCPGGPDRLPITAIRPPSTLAAEECYAALPNGRFVRRQLKPYEPPRMRMAEPKGAPAVKGSKRGPRGEWTHRVAGIGRATGILRSTVPMRRKDMVDGNRNKPPLGDTALVQSCARMMSAAWIEQQLSETSTAPLTDISGIALALKHTIASDLGMGFELAIKSLVQELPDFDVRPGHDLIECWGQIPPDVQGELDADVEQRICLAFGNRLLGGVLPFEQYLDKHMVFLNRTVDDRYALKVDDNRLIYSEALFIGRAGRGLSPINKDIHGTLGYADGIGVLAIYWRTLMEKVLDLRWPEGLRPDNGGPWPQKDEARSLVRRAADQLVGPLSVMSEEELKNKRLRQLEAFHPELRGMAPYLLPDWERK